MPDRLDPLERRLAEALAALKETYPEAETALNMAFDLGYVLAMHDTSARLRRGAGTLDRSGTGGSPCDMGGSS